MADSPHGKEDKSSSTSVDFKDQKSSQKPQSSTYSQLSSNGDSSSSQSKTASTATLPGSDQSTYTIENPTGLVNAYERQKEENKELKQSLTEFTNKLSTMEEILGQIDEKTARQIKSQLEEAEKNKREAEEFRQKLIADTKAELEAKYNPQVRQLEQSNLTLTNSLEALFRQQALSDAFSRNNGADYNAFSALLPGRMKPVYVEYEDPTSPTGKRMKLQKFTNMDDTPIIDENGRELAIGEVFKAANTGKYGLPLKATFNDFNQAQGDGFYQGSVGSDIVNPWTEKHWNLTAQGRILKENAGLAKQMAAQAGKKI
jgi:hypothetical protein